MALVDMKAMLRHAYEHGYAIGGFDVVDLGFVAGVMHAMECCQAPVILSLAESFRALRPRNPDAGSLSLHGWYYDLATNTVERLQKMEGREPGEETP